MEGSKIPVDDYFCKRQGDDGCVDEKKEDDNDTHTNIIVVIVVVVIVAATRKPPKGGTGKKRYERKPMTPKGKRILNEKYYRNIKK